MYDLRGKRIYVAGHRGMVGSAVVRRLAREDCEIITAGRDRVDLMRQAEVEAFMQAERPDAIVMAAAKVGGILANDTYPADFLYNNLIIEANITEAAHRADVNRMLFLGSSCIYPKFADQPIREEALLTGALGDLEAAALAEGLEDSPWLSRAPCAVSALVFARLGRCLGSANMPVKEVAMRALARIAVRWCDDLQGDQGRGLVAR